MINRLFIMIYFSPTNYEKQIKANNAKPVRHATPTPLTKALKCISLALPDI